MARFSGLPIGYAPWLALSARTEPEGGDLLNPLRPDPSSPACAARELVVLVHGFNNHVGQAASAYEAFRRRQYPLSGMTPPGLESDFGDFFWPGDGNWGLLDAIDFLIYPVAVRVAPEAGFSLANYLCTLPNLVVVHFVGHSLGCRVILECIQAMGVRSIQRANEVSHPVIGRVVLMAAAVRTTAVMQGGELALAASLPQSMLILHSTSDWVLHYTFPPGETLPPATEGLLPVALGRTGPPPGMPGTIEPHPIFGAGHGDYWGAADNERAEPARSAVAAYVADYMQLGKLAGRMIGTRAPSSPTLADLPRIAAAPRSLPKRVVGDPLENLYAH